MTNIEKIVADRHQMLIDFEANKREIAERRVLGGDDAAYMLIWKFDGSSLFVGRRPKATDTSATGFGWAIVFRSEADAARYVERTRIMNGKRQQPVPVTVAEARAIALSNIDGVIKTLKAMDGAR